MPTNAALAVERGAAGEAELRRRLERASPLSLAATVEIALPPPWLCGSAMPTSVRSGPSARRRQYAAGTRSGAP